MTAILEIQLLIKIRVVFRNTGELVRTTLVTGDAFPCTAVSRHLVIIIGCAEFRGKFERQEIEARCRLGGPGVPNYIPSSPS